MDKTEAIARIKDHIYVHGIGRSRHIKIGEALDMAIKALENMDCGCPLCLSHHNMQCPKMSAGGNISSELTYTTYPDGDVEYIKI